MNSPRPTVPSPSIAARYFEQRLAGEQILVTGHTGFTGGWLCLWLRAIGAEVTGLALPPSTAPNLFTAGGIAEGMVASIIGDIRDPAVVAKAFAGAQPSVVIHLAAQPLVSRGYEDPIETFSTNVMGTANVLEAARTCPSTRAVVCITTDKVYADQDWPWGYRENDRLGGKDPYSASKAAAEIVAASYQRTMAERGNGVAIACARGGNIIGGGDWSENRIVADFVRAQASGAPLVLRNPEAVRPWQHVMALVHGYLVLAARLLDDGPTASEAWNLGPLGEGAKTVRELVEALSSAWARPDLRYVEGAFPETRFLHLDSTKARSLLHWHPPLGFAETARLTAEWYRDFHERGMPARDLCLAQIEDYRAGLAEERRGGVA